MLTKLKRRWRALRQKTELDRELDDELQFHLARDIESNVRNGMNREEARYAAMRSFGGVEQAKEECRDARGVRLIEEFWQDIRYGARMLLKSPGITFVVILALALGIGANTAIFSVLNAVVLTPLPYDHPEQLMFLTERTPVSDSMSISYPNFTDWRNQNHVFEKIGVYNGPSYTLTGYGEAERIQAGRVSADLFSALRANAFIGRIFTNDEDKPGAPPVVVLSYALWQRRFGGQNNILNQQLTLNGKGYTVIGVMPPAYAFPTGVDMWVPVGQQADDPDWQQRSSHPGLKAVARLKPGVSQAQAQADMNTIAANLSQQYPKSNAGNGVRIRTLTEVLVGDTVTQTLWILFGAVAFVLLIACANIANLLLARATARQKEMAVRAAMGAGRWRIARQLLTESILVGIAGGACGIALAHWGLKLILYASPTAIPRSAGIRLDWRVLAFTLGVSVLTGILFGLVPAIQSGVVDVQGILKESGRGTSARHWLRSALVIAEVATTMVLLIGAGLMIRSFYRLENVNPGFSDRNLTTFNVDLPEKKYASAEQNAQFFNRLLENVSTLPGVQSVAAANDLPLVNGGYFMPFVIEGRPAPSAGDTPSMAYSTVSPDYFRTMNIPLLRGRYFTDHDDRSFAAGRDFSKMSDWEQRRNGSSVIIVDEEFARRYWPNEEAVGKRIRLDNDPKAPVVEIVGIVGRVKLQGLTGDDNHVQAYFSSSQFPFNGMTIIIKGTGDPNQLIASARNQVKALDPDQPIYNVLTMDEIRSQVVAPDRLNLMLLSTFAGIALVLAIVGIYGVMSYAVTQRTREIGIRMAIGAQPSDVFRSVMRQGMTLALTGVAFGLAGALGLTRLMTTMLFDVKPTDPLTFVSIAALLTGAALVACYVPGRRATRVNPLVALRYE